MSVDRARIAFGPEAMSRFNAILEEVSLDLIDDGLPAEQVRSENLEQDRNGWWAMRCAYLGLDKSQAVWRKSVRTSGSQYGDV